MSIIQLSQISVSFKIPFESLPPPVDHGRSIKPIKLQVQTGDVLLTVFLPVKTYRKIWERGGPGMIGSVMGLLGSKNTVNGGLSFPVAPKRVEHPSGDAGKGLS